jgi:hypothetical protein
MAIDKEDSFSVLPFTSSSGPLLVSRSPPPTALTKLYRNEEARLAAEHGRPAAESTSAHKEIASWKHTRHMHPAELFVMAQR